MASSVERLDEARKSFLVSAYFMKDGRNVISGPSSRLASGALASLFDLLTVPMIL